MKHRKHSLLRRRQPAGPQTSPECSSMQQRFSNYLDGAMTGVEMAAISAHLTACAACREEFAGWRDVQRSLAGMGAAHPPEGLQAQLLAAVAAERARGAHLSLLGRGTRAWSDWMAPAVLRVSGGVAAALVLVAGLGWLFGAPIAVQANDDLMAHLVAPRYLYSQVPPQPIQLHREVPIVVDALVDEHGRVYDFSILEGPRTPAVQVRVEDNLLASVFRPATAFGVPVPGHVVMTYMGVSVHE